MITFEFEPEGLDALDKRLGESDVRRGIVLNQELRALGHEAVPVLKRHTPTGASRHLRNSTRFQVIQVGDVEQVLEVRQGAATAAGVFYGRFVRGGRRPGRRPPVAALVPWVRAKLGVPPNRARSVAFLVARKIGERGIEPNPYHVRALDELRPSIQGMVNRIGQRVVAHLAGEGQ